MPDRQQDTVSPTGVWVDTDTGKVVEEEPTAGKLLVPPGGVIDQRIQDDIDAARLVAGQTDVEPVEDTDDEDSTGDSDEAAEAKPAARRGGRRSTRATEADASDKATE